MGKDLNVKLEVGGWASILSSETLILLYPKWGPTSRVITKEEAALYIFGQASPIRPGQISRDYSLPLD